MSILSLRMSLLIRIYFGYNIRKYCNRQDKGSLHYRDEAVVDNFVDIINQALNRGLVSQIKRFLICGGRPYKDEEINVCEGFSCQYKIDMLDR